MAIARCVRGKLPILSRHVKSHELFALKTAYLNDEVSIPKLSQVASHADHKSTAWIWELQR